MDLSFVEVMLTPWALALVGLCIGSFLNVVIHRLPQMLDRGWKAECADMLGVKVDLPPEMTLSTPRSRCPSCGHAIAWYEKIPVMSYLWLRGKCSACKTPISARYPFFEVLTAAIFAAPSLLPVPGEKPPNHPAHR
jgi:leader peptidase (prepilin peptidase)/N-methyltransferase